MTDEQPPPGGEREKPGPPESTDRDRNRDKDRAPDRDRDPDAGDAPGADDEAAERERERERAAGRFREHTRDPLADEQGDDGPTDLAAASRARRSTRTIFDTGRDLINFDQSTISSAHIGDVHLRLEGLRPGRAVRSGPVPEEELRRLRRAHVEPDGYQALRAALGARRLLVLGAAPGTGRTSTALALLDELTAAGAPGDSGAARVSRVGPDVRLLTESLPAQAGNGDGNSDGDGARDGARGEARGGGHLLELPLAAPGELPPEEMDLDALAAALDRAGAYAVVVVPLGAATDALVTGRYGMRCPPVPTDALLAARLDELLLDREPRGAPDDDGPGDLAARAAELAARPAVKEAVGLKDLRPAEAEVVASLLAGHLLGELSYQELLTGCRSIAAAQAREWFAGVDRILAAPAAADGDRAGRPAAASLFHPVAFRIALAVLGGASHSAVASAAHLLTWELSVQSDPDTTPARPLFCDDPETDLALSRAEAKPGRVEVAGSEVDARLIWYRGSALPAAVLSEIWDRHFPVRAPVVRWLRLLADDPRPQVWMRAAVAAGELCVRDFEYGWAELIRPLAEASSPRRRVFAATILDQAAGHASHRRAVRRTVDDWSRYGTKALRWTAAMALGYGNAAASAGDTLDALARIGTRDDGDQLAVASFNAVRLLAGPAAQAVLRRLDAWTHHKRPEYQDLGLVTTVRLAVTRVDEVLDDEDGSPVGDRGDWPLPLALAAVRPGLVRPMADLLWTALNTARSKEVALDALESLLRTAVRRDGAEWTRSGLAALLPAMFDEEHDLRQLDWLLRRMMRDQDDPLPDAQARDLWWLADAPPDRRGEEERDG
ncbi:hypothetical protein [Streptomyces genisteinicus]|uniref:Uncharacterized protein n=1 Tax=Streptomyces genisteinicus TaxID=2768068 RepID=A0A7H0HU78_9ACTN|nr:hypothetical protein [Streptomyces genisteinicus]QNP64094.1 hypothetical protein IAG43_15040 [Streptomyces genisteinicus]